MKMTVIPIVIGALGILSKESVRGLQDLEIRVQAETIKTTSLLKSAKILRIILET